MIRLNNILITLSVLLAISSCTKQEKVVEYTPNPMLFGIENIAQTKISYAAEDVILLDKNGNPVLDKDGNKIFQERVTAEFEEWEQVGVYAFYNNFYYWYDEYQNFAESIIFPNIGMNVRYGTSGKYLEYSPLKSWTFSTIYGDSPHTLDAVAYYPLVVGYHPEQLQMLNTTPSNPATLEYFYAYKETSTGKIIVNSHIDFMTAHTRYDNNEKDPIAFRKQMLALEYIPLSFTRQTAVLNIQVTKPAKNRDKIEINGLTVEFDAPLKFTQKIAPYSSTPNENAAWDITTMASQTEGFGEWLTATTTFSTPKVLKPTGFDDNPDDNYQYVVEKLFDYTTDKEQLLYFPTGTDINKITFDITVTGEDNVVKTDQTEFVWHPHIAPIKANRLLTLTLELDPSRES